MPPQAVDSHEQIPPQIHARIHAFGGLPDRAPMWVLSMLGAALWWVSQPPLGLSFIAWVAAIPWLAIACRENLSRRQWLTFLAVAFLYWVVTMQGIRHAHPAMHAALVALAFYLACYSLLFVWLVRKCAAAPRARLPLWIAVPLIGTGWECIRNYLLTGVSAVMIGHTQAPHPSLIQITDAFGSYGLTFLVLLVNASLFESFFRREKTSRRRWQPIAVAALLLAATLGYGEWRLSQAAAMSEETTSNVNVALIGRDEEIVFIQNSQRELEIFDAYFRQSMEAATEIAKTNGTLDAIVWPESMFNGSLPWLLLDKSTNSVNSQTRSSNDTELLSIIEENRSQFQRRAAQVQAAIRQATGQANDPHLIVGCSVIRYQEPPQIHSAIVHIGDRGNVVDWYGKTHLVMFGEYIPLIDYLPFINRWVPPGLGIERGSGPMAMAVGALKLSPNICIETAVERVTPNHVIELIRRGEAPDAIVNVTNDGWFDRSSIVEHHLRCSQFVAVASRRPVLISANGGPTAWIDGSGRVVQRLANDEAGSIITSVVTDGRWGLYQTIRDWPARLMAAFCIWLVLREIFRWLAGKSSRRETLARSPQEP